MFTKIMSVIVLITVLVLTGSIAYTYCIQEDVVICVTKMCGDVLVESGDIKPPADIERLEKIGPIDLTPEEDFIIKHGVYGCNLQDSCI